jgi:outer membrane lipoprotein-sorting protein
MKTLFTALMVLASTVFGLAQTADQIINDCNEVTGGKKWDAVKMMKMSTTLEQEGMKIPFEIVMHRDGRMYTKINIQGMELIQGAYDGTTLWSTSYLSQKAEKSDSETTENHKRTIGEFPSALNTYKSMGHSVSLEGEEKVDGVDCYKIKMTKKTQLVEGVEVPNIEYYFIDKDSKALIMVESEIMDGELKGKISQVKFSDYQEVNGVFVAYSIYQGIKDMGGQTITFEKIEINPEVSDEIFKYKGEN